MTYMCGREAVGFGCRRSGPIRAEVVTGWDPPQASRQPIAQLDLKQTNTIFYSNCYFYETSPIDSANSFNIIMYTLGVFTFKEHFDCAPSCVRTSRVKGHTWNVALPLLLCSTTSIG
jgi:hypothetical protein